MGTRKSRHNKGRKPIYKEHRQHMLHDVFSNGSTETEIVEDNSFLFYPNAKAFTLATARSLTEVDAEHVFCSIRWVDGAACCPRCQSDDLWMRGARRRWRCRNCSTDFAVTTGTLFASHKMSWRTMLIAIAITVGANRRNKPSEMAREMNVTFKAAFTLVNKIREAASMNPLEPEGRKKEKFSLDRPRYMNGLWLSTRTWWSAPEDTALQQFIKVGAKPTETADALGRSPKSLAWRARDAGITLSTEWSQLIAAKGSRVGRRSILSYPYITRAKPEHADLLALNALVPHAFPEHMRADICQEMMLAVFEGKVTVAEVKANRERAAWFLKKFWRDNYELAGHTVSLDITEGDGRSYYEVASGLAAKQWISEQRYERGRHEDIMRTFNPPTQIEDTYFSQVRRKQMQLNLAGRPMDFEDVEEILNASA